MKGSQALAEIGDVVAAFLDDNCTGDLDNEFVRNERMTILRAWHVMESAMLSNTWGMEHDWSTDSVRDLLVEDHDTECGGVGV